MRYLLALLLALVCVGAQAATVGRTTQGTLSRSIENRPYLRQVTFTAGDQLTSIDVWITTDNTFTLTPALYDSTGDRLAVGAGTGITSNVSAQNIQCSISFTITTTGTYYIGVAAGAGPGGVEVFYDATGAVSVYDADASLGSPPPDPYPDLVADTGTDNVSIAGTYTPGASSTVVNPISGRGGAAAQPVIH